MSYSRLFSPSRVSSVSRTLRFSPRLLTRPLTTVTVAETPLASAAPAVDRPHHIVVSLAGEDRVGIVRTVSAAVTAQNANVEESKMAILGGDFAMIVYVSAETANCADSLASRLKAELPDFSISVRKTTPPVETVEKSLWMLEVEGPDSPGIVSAITTALAKHEANVHDLDTETSTAPFAGFSLFKMKGTIAISDEELDKLNESMASVEEQFGTSVILEQISAD